MFYDIRIDEVRALLCQLFRASSEGQFSAVDMKSMFFELTLNNMMRMISGKRYYGDNVTELEETRKFREIVAETFELSGATNIVDFVPFLKWIGLNGIEKKLVVLQGKRDGFMQNLIEEHRRMRSSSCEGRSKTLLDVLLSLQETEPECYTDDIIRGMMQVISLHLHSRQTINYSSFGGKPSCYLKKIFNSPQSTLSGNLVFRNCP